MAVYFLASFKDNLMKIGFSGDPVKRVKDIKSNQPIPEDLILLLVLPQATMRDEKALHEVARQFHKTHREWFHLSHWYHDRCTCNELVTPHTLIPGHVLGPNDPLVWNAEYGDVQVQYRCSSCSCEWDKYVALELGPLRVLKRTTIKMPYPGNLCMERFAWEYWTDEYWEK